MFSRRAAFAMLAVALTFPLAIAHSTELLPASGPIDAAAFEEHLRHLYGTAESYSHTCSWTQKTDGAEEWAVPLWTTDQELTSTFFFQRPDKFALIREDVRVVVNGASIWTHDLKSNRFEKSELGAEESIEWVIVSRTHPMDMPFISVISYLIDDESDSRCDPRSDDDQWTPRVSVEARNGVPGKRLTWASTDETSATESGLWVSDIDGAIHEWQGSSTGEYWPDGADSGNDPVEYTTTTAISCSEVQINMRLDPGTFEFVPDDDSEEVESLHMNTFDPRPPWEERVQPTVRFSDGSLAELDQDRLESLDRTSLPHPGGFHSVSTTDADFDGTPDLLISGFGSGLTVFNGATGETTSFTLRGRAMHGSTQAPVPIPIGTETAWLVHTMFFDHEGSKTRSVCALHGPGGEEWWVYSPEVSDEVSTEMSIAAGDLDGDSQPEIVVATVLQKRVPFGPTSWSTETESSILTILDIDGERLVQRMIDGGIHGIHIRESQTAGRSSIVVVTDGRIEEFALAP